MLVCRYLSDSFPGLFAQPAPDPRQKDAFKPQVYP